MLIIRAKFLEAGDILILPFARSATVGEVSVGTKYVTLHFKEKDLKTTRIDLREEVAIEDRLPDFPVWSLIKIDAGVECSACTQPITDVWANLFIAGRREGMAQYAVLHREGDCRKSFI